jgi:hypothetical protein
VLSEFAQVLPRRRAVFERQRGKLVFTLRGVVPAHGPMQFPMESEYLGISFLPVLGQPGETGRNRIELVLQTRDPAVDSDLAWSDGPVLASGLLDPGGSSSPPVSVVSGPVIRFPPVLQGPNLGELLDPVIWSANAAIPDPGGKPARIAVREYERYYTDNAVAERRGGTLRQRRLVEERLVYSVFFDL